MRFRDRDNYQRIWELYLSILIVRFWTLTDGSLFLPSSLSILIVRFRAKTEDTGGHEVHFQFSLWDSLSPPSLLPEHSTFNSHCEILESNESIIKKTFLTFNSHCEIQGFKPSGNNSTSSPFQFSLWDSTWKNTGHDIEKSFQFSLWDSRDLEEILEGIKTFNSHCEIPKPVDGQGLPPKWGFQFSLWDS